MEMSSIIISCLVILKLSIGWTYINILCQISPPYTLSLCTSLFSIKLGHFFTYGMTVQKHESTVLILLKSSRMMWLDTLMNGEQLRAS